MRYFFRLVSPILSDFDSFVYLFVVLFAVCLQYFDRTMKTGIIVRASLVPMIYRHAMRMSNQARQERSVGAIVNHMASDTEKLLLMCTSLHNLWSAPMRLALGVALLILNLGVAGIFGVISVIVIMPIQTMIMKRAALAVKAVMSASDGRIKILNEVLGGMRVIKYYAWEQPFQMQVKAMREAELQKLWTANI